jgi:hypothetical protein
MNEKSLMQKKKKKKKNIGKDKTYSTSYFLMWFVNANYLPLTKCMNQ